ncbi:hypothetical protein QTP70_004378 [Hemibagrus guttatus]|uniref:Reverse transcriptase domain-containing protein n=1 Tax=Hemibagrus guttatus TaxID=175788 RepID=A0AAE0VFM7_9TELE|nr:hypothetical protein QTP70_004378 [Hemibagrus guttatus]
MRCRLIGISILSVVCDCNNLHDPNQSGFKAEHSTETALLAVTEKLHAARSAKLSSVLILLDLSAAFDTVNRKTLLSTLRSLGICGTAWEWFASYLDGCSYQRDSTGGAVWRQSKRGEIEMVWACAEEGYGLHWKNNAEDGTTRKEEKRKEVYGCVHNIIQRFRESGTISVRKGQGRKTILDARDLRALRRHCITYRNATVMEITTWAQEYFQKTLSVNTIHRAIRRRRLKLYRSKKKPYLNMIQKRRRFLWAKAHLKWTVAKWKTVLWSDQSKFEVLFGKLGRRVIRTKEDKDNPSRYRRSVQKPASLMLHPRMKFIMPSSESHMILRMPVIGKSFLIQLSVDESGEVSQELEIVM